MKYASADAARQAAKDHLAAGRKIAAKAEAFGRNLTPDERAQVEVHVADARKANAAAEAMKAGDADLLAGLQALGHPVGGTVGQGTPWRGSGLAVKGRLSTDAIAGAVGRKAVVESGSTIVPTPIVGDLRAEGRRPTLVAELLPVATVAGDTFRFLQHTTRTNLAATVERGALKPTSVFTVESVDDRCRTIAHLSEPIHRADLDDSTALRAFLDAEMRYGVLEALDSLVVNADGTGEDFEGLLEVAGQVMPFTTDVLTTTRNAITAHEVAGIIPNRWLFHPVDWAALELTRSDEVFVLGDPGTPGSQVVIDRARRRLWGIDVMTSPVVPQGVAILLDTDDVVLVVREQVRVDVSENVADDFSRNLVRIRSEMRAGLAPLRPAGIMAVYLAPGS